jgi:hypothetical protein
MHESIHPVLLPPSRRRDLFTALDLARVGSYQLYHCVYHCFLRHAAGQLLAYRGLLESLRHQLRSHAQVHLPRHLRHQHHHRRLRRDQRRLRRGAPVHHHMALHNPKEAENRPERAILSRVHRDYRKLLPHLLADQ